MNDDWAIDFMSDRLFDEGPFRILTIVDCFARDALATDARTNFRAYQVIDELDRLARIRGKPRSIRVDNGPEFAGHLVTSAKFCEPTGKKRWTWPGNGPAWRSEAGVCSEYIERWLRDWSGRHIFRFP